jgi:hypothetical protein
VNKVGNFFLVRFVFIFSTSQTLICLVCSLSKGLCVFDHLPFHYFYFSSLYTPENLTWLNSQIPFRSTDHSNKFWKPSTGDRPILRSLAIKDNTHRKHMDIHI